MPLPLLPIAAGVAAVGTLGYILLHKKENVPPPTIPQKEVRRPADLPLPPEPPSAFKKAVEAQGVSLTPGMTPAHLVPAPPPPKVPDQYFPPPNVVVPPNAVRIPEVTVTGSPMRFTPGPQPTFSATPAAGLIDTAAHRAGQKDLLRFLIATRYAQGLGDETSYLPALQGVPYTEKDINGKIDARTRAVTWLAQRWINVILQPGTKLAEDGLFGPTTYAALKTIQ